LAKTPTQNAYLAIIPTQNAYICHIFLSKDIWGKTLYSKAPLQNLLEINGNPEVRIGLLFFTSLNLYPVDYLNLYVASLTKMIIS